MMLIQCIANEQHKQYLSQVPHSAGAGMVAVQATNSWRHTRSVPLVAMVGCLRLPAPAQGCQCCRAMPHLQTIQKQQTAQ